MTIRDLLTYIKESPDVCGLEQIQLDNIENKGLTGLRAVTYTAGPYMIIEHDADKQPEDGVTTKELYDALMNINQYSLGLTKDSLFFVGNSNTYPRPKCVDGVLYLHYVPPIEKFPLIFWPNEYTM